MWAARASSTLIDQPIAAQRGGQATVPVGAGVGAFVAATTADGAFVVATGQEHPHFVFAPIACSCALPVICVHALAALMAPHVILVYFNMATSSSTQPAVVALMGTA